MRLVQLQNPHGLRRVAVVEESKLCVIDAPLTVVELARQAIARDLRLVSLVEHHLWRDSVPQWTIDYDTVYAGTSEWKLLPPIDHPDEPARCLVTGTGLTHRASAENRESMHAAINTPTTDSMRMYQIGVAGGRPPAGQIGAPPEWFYKGCGVILRAHGEPLDSPPFAGDGGEEAEIAGAYIIAPDGTPCRIGLVQGNEFSDHVMEARNYLYLAPSKLRQCALGPEIVIDADFGGEVLGESVIRRGDRVIWREKLASGEKWMCHTLANLEHHHFCHAAHRRPGDLHIHFLGADAFSYRDKLRLEDGDVMEIRFDGFGRPLRNAIRIDRTPPRRVAVKVL